MHLFTGLLMAVSQPDILYYWVENVAKIEKLIRFFPEIRSLPAGGCFLNINEAFFKPATGHRGSDSLMPGTG